MDAHRQAAARLAELTRVETHDVAVVLGSGSRPAADVLGKTTHELSPRALPGFQAAGVEGHDGSIRSVRSGSSRLLVFLGRTHLREGFGMDAVAHPVRTAVSAGCRIVVLTNAAGAVNPDLAVGQPVLIADHISLTAASRARPVPTCAPRTSRTYARAEPKVEHRSGLAPL